MPLIKSKSKKAFSKNVAAEMDAGKPQDQSLAIAYGIQKQSKRKKMAYGGKAEADGNPGTPRAKPDDRRPAKDQFMSSQNPVRPNSPEPMLAVGPRASIDSEQDNMSVAERIRRKKMAQGGEVSDDQMGLDAMMKEHYADGGMVDLDELSEEQPNDYYKQNQTAANEDQYDDDQISKQPMDSNEHGDSIDSDLHDMVSKIRAKLKSKRSE